MTESLSSIYGSERPPEEMRDTLRKRLLSSTYAFAKFICGFKDLDPDLHLMMAKWVQRPSLRKLGLAPRGCLKSSVWTVADTLRIATADPDTTILLLNETERLPAKWLGQMQDIILHSKDYNWLFPEVVPDPSKVAWNQTQIELRRTIKHAQATIEAYGCGGASTGNHYFWVKEDDLVGKKAREEPSTMEKAIEQHMLAESLLISPSENQVQTFGTRWAFDDLVAWMLEHEGSNLDILKLSCFRPDGLPIWPKRYSAAVLEAIRAKYGPAWFSLQYLNEAWGVGETTFKLDWLKYYRLERTDNDIILHLETGNPKMPVNSIPLSECTVFQTLDPGISKESRDARTASVVFAITPSEPFEVVLLDTWARAVDPPAAVDRAAEMWMEWQPELVGLEVFGPQMHLFYWIAQRFPKMPLRKLPQDVGRRKEARITENLMPYLPSGRFYVRREMSDFINEYTGFPNARTKDIVDALAWGPSIWYPPEQRETMEFGIDPFDAEEKARAMMGGRSPITGY